MLTSSEQINNPTATTLSFIEDTIDLNLPFKNSSLRPRPFSVNLVVRSDRRGSPPAFSLTSVISVSDGIIKAKRNHTAKNPAAVQQQKYTSPVEYSYSTINSSAKKAQDRARSNHTASKPGKSHCRIKAKPKPGKHRKVTPSLEQNSWAENETVEAGKFYSKPEPAYHIAERKLVTIPALTRPRHSFTYSADYIDSTDLNNGTWGYGAPRGDA